VWHAGTPHCRARARTSHRWCDTRHASAAQCWLPAGNSVRRLVRPEVARSPGAAFPARNWRCGARQHAPERSRDDRAGWSRVVAAVGIVGVIVMSAVLVGGTGTVRPATPTTGGAPASTTTAPAPAPTAAAPNLRRPPAGDNRPSASPVSNGRVRSTTNSTARRSTPVNGSCNKRLTAAITRAASASRTVRTTCPCQEAR
jgi:hypothetical protein